MLNKILDYIYKVRFVLLLVSVTVIIVEIFLIGNATGSNIFLFILIWIGVLIGYGVEARINFIFALILFIFAPVLIVINLEYISEQIVIWAYIFLIVGTIQSIIEIRKNKECKDIKQFFYSIIPHSFITKVIFPISIYLKICFIKVIDKFFITPIDSISRYYASLRKKSMQDILVVFSQIFTGILVLCIGILILGIIGIKVAKLIQTENHKKERLAMNPVIYSIQPSIIYKGMKVIIYGKKFTQQDISTPIIYANNKPVNPDQIFDDKIIFSITLDWKVGDYIIVVDKPIRWDDKIQNTRSNQVELKVIPTTSTMTQQDDAFFKELKTLNPEVRKINGYE